MISKTWLQTATQKLTDAGIDSARLEALLLLEAATGHDRAHILAHPETPLQGLTLQRGDEWLKRRLKREPMAYILGKKEFYGREFTLTPDVLIPRPESEAFIDELHAISREAPWKLLDVGTGSGILAITTKLEFPDWQVEACDISEPALAVAQQNAQKFSADMRFFESNLLRNVTKNYDVVLANLPYVPNDVITTEEITKEPELALFSGADGLSHYRSFFEELATHNTTSKYVLTESLETQHKNLEVFAQKSGYTLIKTNTLIQVFKKI
jgi:release factor glutamine methyltransferase